MYLGIPITYLKNSGANQNVNELFPDVYLGLLTFYGKIDFFRRFSYISITQG